MEALIWNRTLTGKYYLEISILYNEEYSGMFLMLLENLMTLKFRLHMKDTNLDMPDYWSFVIPAEISSNVQPSPKPEKKVTEPIRTRKVKKKPSQRRNIRVTDSPSKQSYESYKGEGLSDSLRSDNISESIQSDGMSYQDDISLSSSRDGLSSSRNGLSYKETPSYRNEVSKKSQSMYEEPVLKKSQPSQGTVDDTKQMQRSQSFQKRQEEPKHVPLIRDVSVESLETEKKETTHSEVEVKNPDEKEAMKPKVDVIKTQETNQEKQVMDGKKEEPIVQNEIKDTPFVEKNNTEHFLDTGLYEVTVKEYTEDNSPLNTSSLEKQTEELSIKPTSEENEMKETIQVEDKHYEVEKLNNEVENINNQVEIPDTKVGILNTSPSSFMSSKTSPDPSSVKTSTPSLEESLPISFSDVIMNTPSLNSNKSTFRISMISMEDLNDQLASIEASPDYKTLIKDLHQSIVSVKKQGPLIQDLDDCINLLYTIETILTDGVKKSALLRQWTFLTEESVDVTSALWACFSRIREVLPEGGIVVEEIKRKPLSTPQGLARAFLHASLNRKELKSHVEAILKMEDRLSEMYGASILKNAQIVEFLLYYLDILSQIDFRLPSDDKAFDEIRYYYKRRKHFLVHSHKDLENSYQPASYLEKRYQENSSYKTQSSLQSPPDMFGFSSSLEPSTPVISETPTFHRRLQDSYDASNQTTFYMSPDRPRKDEEVNREIPVNVDKDHTRDKEIPVNVDKGHTRDKGIPVNVEKINFSPETPKDTPVFSPESLTDSSFSVFGKSLLNRPSTHVKDSYQDRISTTHVQSNLMNYNKSSRTQTMQRFAPQNENHNNRRQTLHMGRKITSMPFSYVQEPDTSVPVESKLPTNILSHSIIKEYESPRIYSKVKHLEDRKDIYVVKSVNISDIETHKTKYQDIKPHDFFLLEDQVKKPFSMKLAICPDCGTDITASEARWCTYTGSYYCMDCHIQSGSIIPSRIIFQWDFKSYKVSEFARTYIQNNLKTPVIDLKDIFSRMEGNSEYWYLSAPAAIGKIQALREKIVRISQFLRTCRNSETHLAKLNERKHFAWSSSVWSLKDLLDLKEGKLRSELQEVEELFRNHVVRCEICKGKGFYCEICSKKELLFHFDDQIAKCQQCKSVFHGKCYKESVTECPKCKRIEKLKAKRKDVYIAPKTISTG